MNELSPEARALLTAARTSGVPTVSRRRDIKSRVLVRVAAVAAASAGGSAAAATSIVAKWVVAGVLATTFTGGALGVWKVLSQHEVARAHPGAGEPSGKSRPGLARRSEPEPNEAAGEPPAAEGAAAGRMSLGKSAGHEAGRAHAAARLRATAPTAAEGRLGDEVAVLQRAQEALRVGNPSLALGIVEEYDRDFAHGLMSEERRAIGAIATCQAHPGPLARDQAQSFLRTLPESLLGERVRAACFPGGPEAAMPKIVR